VVKKGAGDELVVFLTPVSDQVTDALADRYCVAVADYAADDVRSADNPEEGLANQRRRPAAVIEQCGFRRAHLVGRGMSALDFFIRRSDLVQSLVLADASPDDPADYRTVLDLIDVPLLLLNANPFLTALHAAVPMSQLLNIDLDDPRALTRALWSHLLRARAIETQTLTASTHRGRPPRAFISTSVQREVTGDSVLVPHDDIAIAMAQGHSLISGRAQSALTSKATQRVTSIPLAPVTPSPVSEPSAESIERVARVIGAAHRPLIITGELGRHRGGPEALVQLAQRHGIAVVEHGARPFLNFPTQHPLHLGFNSSAFVKYADAILVIECDEPWLPEFTNLSHDPKIIRTGVDLGGHPALAIRRLTSSLDKSRPDRERIAGRLAAYASEHRRVMQQAQSRAIAEAARPHITPQFLSYCIGEAIDDRVTIWNDSDLDPQLVPRRLADSWFGSPVPGWILGAALGGQLANRDQTMVIVMSDASYRASEPLAAHAVANAKKLPVVVIVFNEDAAVRCDAVAEACGAKGMRVENPRELAAAIRAALQIARGEKRQVLLNVVVVV
jgi:thiamine pyrophosphate-dependent acetolactate synthase large subunit-like protein